MWWHLKSLALPLSTQLFIQAHITENIEALCHWPLCGEFTGEWPVTRKMFPFDDLIMGQVSWYSINMHCSFIDRILPKGPYPPCLRMADRALLAGYPRHVGCCHHCYFSLIFIECSNPYVKKNHMGFAQNNSVYFKLHFYDIPTFLSLTERHDHFSVSNHIHT